MGLPIIVAEFSMLTPQETAQNFVTTHLHPEMVHHLETKNDNNCFDKPCNVLEELAWQVPLSFWVAIAKCCRTDGLETTEAYLS